MPKAQITLEMVPARWSKLFDRQIPEYWNVDITRGRPIGRSSGVTIRSREGAIRWAEKETGGEVKVLSESVRGERTG